MKITMHAIQRCGILAALVLLLPNTANALEHASLFEDLRKMPILKGVPKEEADRLGKATSEYWVELAPRRQFPEYSYDICAFYTNGHWYSTQINISMGTPESYRGTPLVEQIAAAERLFDEIRDILTAAWSPAGMYMITQEDREESGAPIPSASWMDEENMIAIERNPYSGHITVFLHPIAIYTDDKFEPSDSWRELFARKIKPNAGKLPADWREIDLGVPAPDGAPSGDTSHAPPATEEKPGRENAIGRSEPNPGDAGSSIPDSSPPSSTTEKDPPSLGLWAATTVALVTASGFLLWLARARRVRKCSKNNGIG